MARQTEQDESRRILDRVGAETEARMPPSGPSTGTDGDDWAEYWGKRIGRVLSGVLLCVLLIWLYNVFMGMG